MRLSVVIPAYNESAMLETIIDRVMQVACEKQVIVVDDGSTDTTRDVLCKLRERYPGDLLCVSHARNQGKGAAIQTGLAHVTGDVVVIQDADLEYHPEDYPAALRLIEDGWADAVYGSRFLGPHRVFLVWHYVANRGLTMLANVITSGTLSDMETGFKVMRADILLNQLKLPLRGFLEVEITIETVGDHKKGHFQLKPL